MPKNIDINKIYTDILKEYPNSSKLISAKLLKERIGYPSWINFKELIGISKVECSSQGYDADEHFLKEATQYRKEDVIYQKVKDFWLSQYACHLLKNVLSDEGAWNMKTPSRGREEDNPLFVF